MYPQISDFAWNNSDNPYRIVLSSIFALERIFNIRIVQRQVKERVILKRYNNDLVFITENYPIRKLTFNDQYFDIGWNRENLGICYIYYKRNAQKLDYHLDIEYTVGYSNKSIPFIFSELIKFVIQYQLKEVDFDDWMFQRAYWCCNTYVENLKKVREQTLTLFQ